MPTLTSDCQLHSPTASRTVAHYSVASRPLSTHCSLWLLCRAWLCQIDFWDSVYGFDMSCIKKLALLEPLVDMCEAKQVMSSSATLLTIDLHTVTPQQLDFLSHFELQFRRPDTTHALVCYFDIEFRCTHSKVRFSTGPTAEYTHWKQTVFYLEQGVRVDNQQRLKGEMRVRKNEKNPRDIDITIDWMIVGKTKRKTQEYRLR